MISLVVILSLFPYPAATGLICEHCTGETIACKSNIRYQECDPGYACGSEYTKQLSDCKRTSFLIRRCTPLSDCDFKGSMTTMNYQTNEAISCCRHDGCISGVKKILEATKDGPGLNGLVCPGCSLHDPKCHTTVDCRGDEVMCFHLLRKSKGAAPKSLWGCTTQSYCDRGNKITNFNHIIYEAAINCTKASKSISWPRDDRHCR